MWLCVLSAYTNTHTTQSIVMYCVCSYHVKYNVCWCIRARWYVWSAYTNTNTIPYIMMYIVYVHIMWNIMYADAYVCDDVCSQHTLLRIQHHTYTNTNTIPYIMHHTSWCTLCVHTCEPHCSRHHNWYNRIRKEKSNVLVDTTPWPLNCRPYALNPKPSTLIQQNPRREQQCGRGHHRV